MCEGSLDDETPCEACGLELLESSMKCSRAGELLRRALDIDFMKQAGLTIAADDVSCEEFTCLKIIAGERSTYELERREAAQREQQQQSRQR